MTQNGISYVLNASNSCPKPDFICESRFMRIPINDNYCEKLLPWLDKSIEFIGEAGAGGGLLPPTRKGRPGPEASRTFSGRGGHPGKQRTVGSWEGGQRLSPALTWSLTCPQIKPSCPAAKSSSTVWPASRALPPSPSPTS